MGGFLKVVIGYSKIVEGFLKVAERLFRNVLSKLLGIHKFDCKKEFVNVKIKRSRNANKTFTQRFHNAFKRCGNVLSKCLGTQNFDCKKK